MFGILVAGVLQQVSVRWRSFFLFVDAALLHRCSMSFASHLCCALNIHLCVSAGCCCSCIRYGRHTQKKPLMLWRQPNSAMSSVCGPACSGTRLESTGAAFGPLSIPIMIDQSMNMFIYYMAVVMALRDRRAHRPSDRLWNNR